MRKSYAGRTALLRLLRADLWGAALSSSACELPLREILLAVRCRGIVHATATGLTLVEGACFSFKALCGTASRLRVDRLHCFVATAT
jgi:hypothetical protein